MIDLNFVLFKRTRAFFPSIHLVVFDCAVIQLLTFFGRVEIWNSLMYHLQGIVVRRK